MPEAVVESADAPVEVAQLPDIEPSLQPVPQMPMPQAQTAVVELPTANEAAPVEVAIPDDPQTPSAAPVADIITTPDDVVVAVEEPQPAPDRPVEVEVEEPQPASGRPVEAEIEAPETVPDVVAAPARAVMPEPDAGREPAGDLSETETSDDESVELEIAAVQQPTARPESVPVEEPVVEESQASAPQFDLVRVERDGATVIAGRAEPGTEVTVTADGQPIGTATATGRGEFIALVDTPRTGFAQELRLQSGIESDGTGVTSEAAVIVIVEAPSEIAETAAAPVVVISTPAAVEVIQPAAPQPAGQIVLDTISYSVEGEVVLSGRGAPDSTARIYANDAPIAEADIRADGHWTAVISTLDAGDYNLRVDEVTPDGGVTSRAESPFRRVEPALAVATLAEADPLEQIVVQPGNNLWTIARERYGQGPLFTQIFTANSDQIRDPDLIYPGQIFALPGE